MCGFLVLLKSNNREIEKLKIQNVINDLKARGPDHQAVLQSNSSLFVSTRLAHRDLGDGANQPFKDLESRSVIAFNGEIINDFELRNDLIKKAVSFSTRSDTEVILKGYLQEGISFFSKLRGMFSFIIWDEFNKRHIVVRDWFGIKPLYHAMTEFGPVFSSLVKPMKQFLPISPNTDRFMEYLTFGHIAAPHTLFKEIQHFPKGKMAIINSEFKWSFHELHISESKLSLDEILKRNIKGYLQSERKLGVQLSGGIDSTFILQESLNYTENLFSYSVIVPDEENSEEVYQRQALEKFKTHHFSLMAQSESFFSHIDQTIEHLEFPIHHLANVFFDKLFEKASQKSKGLLTGEGGDELFLGYKRYQYDRAFVSNVFSESIDPMTRMQKLFYKLRQVYISPSRIKMICPELCTEYPERLEVLFQRDADSFLEGLSSHDLNYGLDSLLVRQDRLGMAYGLENRPPLVCPDLISLNRKLVESHSIGKIDLKQRLGQNFNRDFIDRKKKGFGLPMGTWLRKDQNYKIFENLNQLSFVDNNELDREIKQLKSNDNESSKYLMRIYVLDRWLKIFF